VLSVPAGYDPARPTPLIFAWHGRTGTAAGARSYFGIETASGGAAIVAYPQGLPVTADPNDTGWELTASGRDLAFYDALSAELRATYCVGSAYSMGHSFGGYMSNAVACFRGGTAPGESARSRRSPRRPVRRLPRRAGVGDRDPRQQRHGGAHRPGRGLARSLARRCRLRGHVDADRARAVRRLRRLRRRPHRALVPARRHPVQRPRLAQLRRERGLGAVPGHAVIDHGHGTRCASALDRVDAERPAREAVQASG
jgi:poly(3-hydroxybutyrate) depolymerase